MMLGFIFSLILIFDPQTGRVLDRVESAHTPDFSSRANVDVLINPAEPETAEPWQHWIVDEGVLRAMTTAEIEAFFPEPELPLLERLAAVWGQATAAQMVPFLTLRAGVKDAVESGDAVQIEAARLLIDSVDVSGDSEKEALKAALLAEFPSAP